MLIWSAAEGIIRVGERGGRCSGFVGGEDRRSGHRRHLQTGGSGTSCESAAAVAAKNLCGGGGGDLRRVEWERSRGLRRQLL